jgi:hypothetical protein
LEFRGDRGAQLADNRNDSHRNSASDERVLDRGRAGAVIDESEKKGLHVHCSFVRSCFACDMGPHLAHLAPHHLNALQKPVTDFLGR